MALGGIPETSRSTSGVMTPASEVSREGLGTIVRGFEKSWLNLETLTSVDVAGLLWRQKVSDSRAEVKEPTSNTRRILSISNFQAAISFSSSFARKNRERRFRFLRLAMCLWISATVLGSRTLSVNFQLSASLAQLTSSVVQRRRGRNGWVDPPLLRSSPDRGLDRRQHKVALVRHSPIC